MENPDGRKTIRVQNFIAIVLVGGSSFGDAAIFQSCGQKYQFSDIVGTVY